MEALQGKTLLVLLKKILDFLLGRLFLFVIRTLEYFDICINTNYQCFVEM